MLGIEALGDSFNRSLGFGSMMEVLHAGAIRRFRQAVGYDPTADGLGMGQEVIQHHWELPM
jgi:hypothetical protein